MFGSLRNDDDEILPPTLAREPESTEPPEVHEGDFPSELVGHIVSFVSDTRVFFRMLLLSKTVKYYLENEGTECSSGLLFTVRDPSSERPSRRTLGSYDLDSVPKSDARDPASVSVLPSIPSLLGASSKQPLNIPNHLLVDVFGVFPEAVAPDVYSFPYEGKLQPKPKPKPKSSRRVRGRARRALARSGPELFLPLNEVRYVYQLHCCIKDLSEDDLRKIFVLFPNLSSLELENAKSCGASVFSVLKKPLDRLEVHECGISDGDFECAGLSSLRSLHIRACGESGALTTGLLQHLPNLERFEIECIVQTFTWRNSDLQHAGRLRKLVLSNVTLGQTLENGEFGQFPNLEVLILNRVSHLENDAFRGISSKIRRLIVNCCSSQMMMGGLSESGILLAVGPEVIVGLEELSFRESRAEWGLMGDMMAPSQFQEDACRAADAVRRENLQSRFQLKHLLGAL